MSRFLKTAIAATVFATPIMAEGLGLGRVATDAEVAAWDIDVRPDGQGLPNGAGDVFTGEEVFAEKCASCHGDFGEAVGRWPVLAGGHDTLTDDRPVKTIGSYWPYLSTVWDYVNRAMPFGNAQSLTPDEVYAITAYLLYVNDLVEDDFELNSENFMSVRLPNEGNFYPDNRDVTELAVFRSDAVCMTDCKESVEITARARVVDVTPEETEEAPKTQEVAQSSEAEPTTPSAEVVATVDPELLAKGEKAFKKCKACHQVGPNAKKKTGPVLNGIVGANVGAVEGFKYSKAMKTAAQEGLVWDEENLSAFLTKPKKFMKGTKMSFNGFKKPEDIEAIIAYLASFE